MKIIVIIPAYNEEQNIVAVVDDILNYYNQADICVINDESHDCTKQLLEERQIQHLNAPINLGIGGAVQLGYLYAYAHGYDIAVQCDGDGQHDAKYIKNIVQPIINGEADICIGSRYILKQGFQSTIMRRIGKSFLCVLIYLCCKYKPSDPTSGFRAVNKDWIRRYSEDYPQDYPEPEALIQAVLSDARVKEEPVIMRKRENGKSSISLLKSIYYMIKVSMAIIICRWRIGKNEH